MYSIYGAHVLVHWCMGLVFCLLWLLIVLQTVAIGISSFKLRILVLLSFHFDVCVWILLSLNCC